MSTRARAARKPTRTGAYGFSRGSWYAAYAYALGYYHAALRAKGKFFRLPFLGGRKKFHQQFRAAVFVAEVQRHRKTETGISPRTAGFHAPGVLLLLLLFPPRVPSPFVPPPPRRRCLPIRARKSSIFRPHILPFTRQRSLFTLTGLSTLNTARRCSNVISLEHRDLDACSDSCTGCTYAGDTNGTRTRNSYLCVHCTLIERRVFVRKRLRTGVFFDGTRCIETNVIHSISIFWD